MKRLKKVLTFLLAAVLVGSAGFIGVRQMEYRKGAQEYADAEQIASLPEPEITETPEQVPEAEREQDPYVEMYASIDLEALREVNPDVIGWISIPYTEVSYPLLRAEDNQYYLKHTWRKESNSVGSIYLECQNAPDLSDFNTIVYGHNMRNGSMFGGLKQYKSLDYWKEHPSLYIVDDNGVHRYDIFAACEQGIRSITFGLEFSTEQRQDLIDAALSGSLIDTGIVPTTEDQVITLTTCTATGYQSRWVVQGVLNKEVSSSLKT